MSVLTQFVLDVTCWVMRSACIMYSSGGIVTSAPLDAEASHRVADAKCASAKADRSTYDSLRPLYCLTSFNASSGFVLL